MAKLYLDRLDAEYATGKYTISVKIEPYKGFRLFEKIRFIDKFGFPFNYFCIIDKGEVVMKDYESRGLNEIDYIEYVDVFVSKYNRDIPLIVRVCNRGQYKYYKWKELEPNTKYDHKNLTKNFKPVKKLSHYLITENEELNNKVTYFIEKKENYNNIEVNDKDKKIDDFKIYTHKPKNGFKSRDSIVLYTNIIINSKPNTNFGKKQISKREVKLNEFDFNKFDHINVYYKNNVKNPLLIQFVISHATSYYYSIRNRRIWNRIDINEKNFKDEMDKIEYQLRPSIRFMLDQKAGYVNKDFRNAKKEKLKNKNNIRNIKTTYSTSEDLEQNDYVCYEHSFNEPYLYKNTIPTHIPAEQKYLAIIIYIFNIGIDTYDKDEKLEYLLYLPGDGLNVFYYKYDNYPLLFSYENKYYGPNSRNEYYTKWVEIKDLYHTDDPKKILTELERINKMLNEIDINKIRDYGVCDEMVEEFLVKDINHICYSTECENKCKKRNLLTDNTKIPTRIRVKCEPCGIYNKYIHTTKNNHLIGCVSYDSIPILKNVQYICDSKGVSIEVYYFNFNSEKRTGYPLMIVCKSFKNLNYYYLTEKFRNNEIDNEPKFYEFTNISIGLYYFLEHQNFLLNDVININMNKRTNYQCCDRNDFNCPKQEVKVERETIGEDSKLEDEKYYTIKHSLKDINSKSEHKSPEHKVPNLLKRKRPITVKNLKIGNSIIKLAHTKKDITDPLFKMSEAYVHFYGDDPRPLLIYSDESAFMPKSLEDYRKNWVLVDDVDYSKRGDGNYRLESVINKLYDISYILNPVDISKHEEYNIHFYFNEKITIIVDELSDVFYKIYVHTPTPGHRLGILKYKNNIIVDESYSTKSKFVEHVLVYYYTSDKDNDYPLFIQLFYKNLDNMCYILTSRNPLKWKKTDKIRLGYKTGKSRRKRNIQYTSELPYDSESMSLRQQLVGELGVGPNLVYEDTLFSSSPPMALGLRARPAGIIYPNSENIVTVEDSKQNISPISGDNRSLSLDIVDVSEQPGTTGPTSINFDPMSSKGVVQQDSPQIITPNGQRSIDLESENKFTSFNTDPNIDSRFPVNEIKTLGTGSTTNSYDNVLANGLGGFFGTLFSLSLISILIYKFLSRLRVREMTPSF